MSSGFTSCKEKRKRRKKKMRNVSTTGMFNSKWKRLFRIFSILGGCHAERYRDVQHFSNASAVLTFCSQGKMRRRKLTVVQL